MTLTLLIKQRHSLDTLVLKWHDIIHKIIYMRPYGKPFYFLVSIYGYQQIIVDIIKSFDDILNSFNDILYEFKTVLGIANTIN